MDAPMHDDAAASHEAAPSTLDALRRAMRELPGIVSDRVQLLSLEMRRAGQALGLMLALFAAAAVLVSTAWVALWGALFAALVQAGLAWGWAALLVIALNLGAAFFAVRRAIALAPLLALPATVRRLTVTSTEGPKPE
jgi:Putative Actinobacterial Holin-X, holin superfamily III